MIVVDASVVSKWVFPEEDSGLALALRDDAIARGERIAAPPLLAFEVTNVARQQIRRGGLSEDEAADALERLLAYPILLRPASEHAARALQMRAFALANLYDLAATYDTHYLALAEALDCALWTADKRFFDAVGTGADIRLLSQYVHSEPPPGHSPADR